MLGAEGMAVHEAPRADAASRRCAAPRERERRTTWRFSSANARSGRLRARHYDPRRSRVEGNAPPDSHVRRPAGRRRALPAAGHPGVSHPNPSRGRIWWKRWGRCWPAPRRPRRADLVTRHSIAESRHALRILLAEDNPVNQQVATAMLLKRGHQGRRRRNGREAVEGRREGELRPRPHDIQMPGMDGSRRRRQKLRRVSRAVRADDRSVRPAVRAALSPMRLESRPSRHLISMRTRS